MLQQANFPSLHPQVVLGIAAHPDDLDFGAGGTFAKFAKQGADIHYLILTDGGKGTTDRSIKCEDLAQIRQTEQTAALHALGGRTAEFLDYPDSCLEVDLELKKDIVKAIRKFQPDVVVTMDPSLLYSSEFGFINHPDHRAAGQATLDAVFPLARDHLSFPELCDEGYEPHKTPTVLLINFEDSNYFVDITDDFDTKIAAIEAHVSQTTADSSGVTMIQNVAKAMGKHAGCSLAESFMRIDIS